jgi:hypothetical protein
MDPCFLDLGISWRWVVSFMPGPLYSQGESPQYPLDRRLGGPQSQSGLCGPCRMQIYFQMLSVRLDTTTDLHLITWWTWRTISRIVSSWANIMLQPFSTWSGHTTQLVDTTCSSTLHRWNILGQLPLFLLSFLHDCHFHVQLLCSLSTGKWSITRISFKRDPVYNSHQWDA